jgi:hypothetical protein
VRLSTFAPAKVNLVLRVGAARPDGYHDILSLMVPLDLADGVDVRIASRPGPVTCEVPGRPDLDGPENLAARAASLFRDRFGVRRAIAIRPRCCASSPARSGSATAPRSPPSRSRWARTSPSSSAPDRPGRAAAASGSPRRGCRRSTSSSSTRAIRPSRSARATRTGGSISPAAAASRSCRAGPALTRRPCWEMTSRSLAWRAIRRCAPRSGALWGTGRGLLSCPGAGRPSSACSQIGRRQRGRPERSRLREGA